MSVGEPVTVLFLTTSLSSVGPASALVNLATRLDPTRFRPVFCHFDSAARSAGPLRARLTEGAVTVRALDARGAFDLRALGRLCRLLRRERVDVLHTRLIRADFYGRLAGRLCGVPLVITNLSSYYSRHFASLHGAGFGRLLFELDRRTLGWAHVIVANSRGVASDLESRVSFHRTRVVEIPNGIDAAVYRPSAERRTIARERLGLDPRTFVVGYVGRLSPDKAVDDLVHAARELKPHVPDLAVVLAGDGPSRPELEALSRRLDLDGTVRFLGHRTDVPEILAALDVFVHPSLHEGQPNAVLESMASGLPVVVTAIPGNSDLVEEGKTGYLVPVRDPKALAARTMRLAQDEAGRAAMGARARDVIVAEHALDETVRRFERLYDEALRDSRRQAVGAES